VSYVGDVRLGDTFDVKFTTVTTTGAPTTLAGTPVISAYPGNSTTELTAGITLTVDFDARTGLNNVRVVATGGNGYATATDYQLVITTGTVGGTSVVGYVVGEFSIEKRSALMPTTAARTALVAADGSVSPNWADVKSPTTTLALTGTTIATTQKVDIETIKTNPVVNGGTITFPTTATLASTTNITAGTITTATTATNLTNAPTAGDFTATMKTSLNAATPASVTGAVGSVTGAVGSVTGAVGSVTGNVGGNVVGSVASVTALAANSVNASALATDAVTEIVTAVFARAFSAAYGSFTFEQLIEIIAAVSAAKCSGMGTATGTFRNLNDSANVVVATIDASGNRSAVTLTP
jgi:hypothetical protein